MLGNGLCFHRDHIPNQAKLLQFPPRLCSKRYSAAFTAQGVLQRPPYGDVPSFSQCFPEYDTEGSYVGWGFVVALIIDTSRRR